MLKLNLNKGNTYLVLSCCEVFHSKLQRFIEKDINGLYFFKFNMDIYKLTTYVKNLYPDRSVYRYFDIFVIVLPEYNDNYKEFWSSFYNEFAKNYEKVINKERNIDCIKLLSNILISESFIPRNGTILDFGCGTGIAFPILKKNFNVIGIDSSYQMRRIANSRGMITMSIEELEISNLQIDGVISSYMLHMIPSYSDLSIIWNHMSYGSIIIGNYYKNIGINEINLKIKSLHGAIKKIDIKAQQYNHGAIYKYKKI